MNTLNIVEMLASQVRLQEARAGRRAVSTCVALPPGSHTASVIAALRRAIRGSSPTALEIEVIPVNGEPRVITVDFELQEAM